LPPHTIGIISASTKAGDANRRGGNGEQQIEVACRGADTHQEARAASAPHSSAAWIAMVLRKPEMRDRSRYFSGRRRCQLCVPAERLTGSATTGFSGAILTFSPFHHGVVTAFALEVGAAGQGDNRDPAVFRIWGSALSDRDPSRFFCTPNSELVPFGFLGRSPALLLNNVTRFQHLLKISSILFGTQLCPQLFARLREVLWRPSAKSSITEWS
jgi:hypothetical protein